MTLVIMVLRFASKRRQKHPNHTREYHVQHLYRQGPILSLPSRRFDRPSLPCTIDYRIYQMLHPHPDTHRDRLSTLNRAQQAIKRNYGSKYKIELFGSVRYVVISDTFCRDLDEVYLRYGITLPRSDLDMTIIVEFLGFLFALRIRHLVGSR